ncbi:hypothetical protein THAOC_33993 [Thalassiosira oceanica]|uniref:Uncharacterized protein n=1 Tax=Thalassiosira oceanica TaxID=159749 RepID=K0RE21_THAOC|nr:hypothetical protein THAOC_33993 [Thalassiosira oceanica]|eukprot:EJK47296.1 hypothetical protein THAOC_33993 [Thalassiosira oceanica]
MFVFGSAAKADADGDDGGGGRGKALSTTDGPPSFAFDASFLSAVTSTTTANGDDAHAAAGGFKFKMPSSQAATEGGEVGDSTPLFGSTLKSRQEVGVGVKTQMKHEAATDGSSNPMGDQLQQAATEPEGFLLYEGGRSRRSSEAH